VALLTRLREARPALGRGTMQDAFEVFELLAAARGERCAASLGTTRGAGCPTEGGGCGDVRWRQERRTHLLLPVPGRGAKADVDLEDLIDVAERPERLDLGGTLCCPACGIRMDPFRLVRFEEPPPVLVIQLMRFKPEGTMWVKSHVPAR
jgi:hypothetical protein